jgi:hypothetical protein
VKWQLTTGTGFDKFYRFLDLAEKEVCIIEQKILKDVKEGNRERERERERQFS